MTEELTSSAERLADSVWMRLTSRLAMIVCAAVFTLAAPYATGILRDIADLQKAAARNGFDISQLEKDVARNRGGIEALTEFTQQNRIDIKGLAVGLDATLKGIDQRLGNIERQLRIDGRRAAE